MVPNQKKTKKIISEKKNEVRRIVNAEKNEMWDRKCTKINIYVGRRRSIEVWEFIKNTTTEKRKTTPIPIISYKKLMNY